MSIVRLFIELFVPEAWDYGRLRQSSHVDEIVYGALHITAEKLFIKKVDFVNHDNIFCKSQGSVDLYLSTKRLA